MNSVTGKLVIVLSLAFILGLCVQESVSFNKKSMECISKACDGVNMEESEKNGESVCTYSNNGNHPIFSRKCMVECSDVKVAEDQLKCACEACKAKAPHFPKQFCKEPNGDHIESRDNCDSTVCTGEAKFRGKHCKRN